MNVQKNLVQDDSQDACIQRGIDCARIPPRWAVFSPYQREPQTQLFFESYSAGISARQRGGPCVGEGFGEKNPPGQAGQTFLVNIADLEPVA